MISTTYNITLLIGILGLLLSGCSQPQQKIIDSTNTVQSCTISAERYSCLFSDGNIYYVNAASILSRTKWDESAWRENIFYCPKDLDINNITNITSQCNYKRICNNPNTGKLEEC